MSGIGTEQRIEEAGGLTNPICEIQMEKSQNPNTLAVPVNFVHTDNGPEIDIITAGVTEFFRNASQSIFNIAVEGSYNAGFSPYNTEWNSVFTDPINNGHGNIQNVQSRTYSDFVTALNSAVAFNVLTTPLVMHDLITDKYYLFTFTQWTPLAAGGGFQYTRTEVVIGSVLCSGRIYFDDGTWMDTAPSSLVSGTPFRVTMFNSGGNGLTESLIECSPVTNVGTNILTGSVDCLIIGNNISAVNAVNTFAYGSNLDLQNASECFVVAHNNTTFDSFGAFSCILLGNLITVTNYADGVYVLGDSNYINDVAYAALFGQLNTIQNTTFSTLSGSYNVLSNSTGVTINGRNNSVSGGSNSTIVGYSNSINNANTSSVFGHQNVVGSNLSSTILIGRNNNATAVVTGGVNILHSNFGFKLTSAFSGIGGSAFTPNARFHILGVDSTLANYSLKVEDSVGSPLLYTRNDGKTSLGTSSFVSWAILNTNTANFGTGAYFAHQNTLIYSDTTNFWNTGDTRRLVFYNDNGSNIHWVNGNVNFSAHRFFTTESGQGAPIERFTVKHDGTLYAGGLQVGNVGLVSGDLYADTAVNILANGDLVVGRKV